MITLIITGVLLLVGGGVLITVWNTVEDIIVDTKNGVNADFKRKTAEDAVREITGADCNAKTKAMGIATENAMAEMDRLERIQNWTWGEKVWDWVTGQGNVKWGEMCNAKNDFDNAINAVDYYTNRLEAAKATDETYQAYCEQKGIDRQESINEFLSDWGLIIIGAVISVIILILGSLHLSKKSKRKHELELAKINSNSQQTPVLHAPQTRLIESATLSKVNFNANAVLDKYAADLGYDSAKVLSDFGGDTERAALALQREAGRKASGMSSTYLDELNADE